MLIVGAAVSSVSFDSTGVYLAIGGGTTSSGAALQVRVVKDWTLSAVRSYMEQILSSSSSCCY